jgi:hypothetical protein
MSRGPGKTQRAIAALIEAEPGGAWAFEHLTARIYGTSLFTRAQKGAIGRALKTMLRVTSSPLNRTSLEPSGRS